MSRIKDSISKGDSDHDEILDEPQLNLKLRRPSTASATSKSSQEREDEFDTGDDAKAVSTNVGDVSPSARRMKHGGMRIGSSTTGFTTDVVIRDPSQQRFERQLTFQSADGTPYSGLDEDAGPASVLITELGESASLHELGKSTGRVSFHARTVLGKQLKLPSVINIVALRESLLSEAPFIVERNRSFWRRMVNNKNFHEILCYTYYFIVSCVNDMGVVDLEKLANAKQAEYIKELPAHLTTMHMTISLKERDALFNRFPEALTYLLLNAMRVAAPKHVRLYGLAPFREILLGWCTEMIYGMRLTNIRAGREWLFTDAADGIIMTNPPTKYKPNVSAPTGCVKRRIEIKNSPLVEMFIAPLKLPSAEKPLILTLSEIPNKDLVTLIEADGCRSHIAKVMKKRMDVVDHNAVKETLSRVHLSRKTRLEALERSKSDLSRELTKMKETLNLDLLILKNNTKTALMNRDLSDIEKRES